MRFWSFPYFHMKLLLLIKTFKGRLMSVPVFPYSNIVYFQFCSYSFNDSFVRHFIFLMRFWSFPNFHMKLLLLIKTFKGRSGPFRYFHTPTSAFKFCLCLFTDSFVHYFMFLMRFWSFPYFHKKLLLLIKTLKGPFRYFHTPTSYTFNSVHIHLMTPLSVIS